MADEADSKSVVGNHVRVQVPLPAVKKSIDYIGTLFYLMYEIYLPQDSDTPAAEYYFLLFFFIAVQLIIKFIKTVKGGKVILWCLCPADQLGASVFFQQNLC